MSIRLSLFQKADTWENLGIVKELRIKASLSGGAGGQNVNKVSTKIELYWTPNESRLIDEDIKQLLITKLASKLSQEGELRIVCEEERSQLKNKEKAIAKFYSLLCSCFKVQKKRKATRPTKSSITKRLDGKSKQKNIKANRKKPDF
jgi:ribosome-associated protein